MKKIRLKGGKIMRRMLFGVFFVIVALLTLAITLFVVIYPNNTQCLLVKWSGMKEVDKNIYVEPCVSKEQVDILLNYIKDAKERVSKLYGGLKTDPTIIVGSSDGFMKKYGMVNPAGSTRKTLTTFIILGPEGMNSTDIIAHELCHSELCERLGRFKTNFMIPLWFDDGLATQVDYRSSHSDNAWNVITNNGKNIPDFKVMNAGKGYNTTFYALSRHEIKQWINKVGRKGLLQFIKDLKSGIDFNKAYNL